MSSPPSARSTTTGALSGNDDIWVKPCHTTAASRSTHPLLLLVTAAKATAPGGPRPPGAPASHDRRGRAPVRPRPRAPRTAPAPARRGGARRACRWWRRGWPPALPARRLRPGRPPLPPGTARRRGPARRATARRRPPRSRRRVRRAPTPPSRRPRCRRPPAGPRAARRHPVRRPRPPAGTPAGARRRRRRRCRRPGRLVRVVPFAPAPRGRWRASTPTRRAATRAPLSHLRGARPRPRRDVRTLPSQRYPGQVAGAGGVQEGVVEKSNFSPVTRGPRTLIVMLAVGVLLSGIGALWLRGSGTPVHAALPVSVGQPTITTTSTSTSTTAPPAAARDAIPSKPITPPAQAYAQEPIIQIGTIEIPQIGLVSPSFHGITIRNIDLVPSHWPGTAFPGENGNAVFAGHRVTHTHPFLHIDQLVNGDLVYFTVQGIRTTYVVTGHEIVKPTELRIFVQAAAPTATLFGCHPPHFATYRYVVHLALVQQ